MSIPKSDIDHRKVAGGHINHHKGEFVRIAVHFRDETVDQFVSSNGRLASDKLLIAHLKHRLCGGVGREMIDGNVGACIGFEASDERGSP